jgi:hypothetical protein
MLDRCPFSSPGRRSRCTRLRLGASGRRRRPLQIPRPHGPRPQARQAQGRAGRPAKLGEAYAPPSHENASRWRSAVSRVLFPRSLPCAGGGHSSRPSVAGRLERPTWDLESARATSAGCPAIPIRSCSGWGLPCPSCHQEGGVLLPHRFTLAGSRGCPHARRFVFCCTVLRVTSTGR